MASVVANTSSRVRTFPLHSLLRSSILRHGPSRRAFSGSPRRQAIDLTEIIVAGPSAFLDGVHALGIPWYAAIPISAAVVRGIFVYYLVTLPNRQATFVRQALSPLVSSRYITRKSELRHEGADSFAETGHGLSWYRFYIRPSWIRFKEMHRIGKDFGAPFLHWRRFGNIAILITFTETIRVKCGARQGLLSLFLSPFEKLRDMVTRTWQGSPDPEEIDEVVHSPASGTTERLSPRELMAQRLEEMRAAAETKQVSQQEQLEGLSTDGHSLIEPQIVPNGTENSLIQIDPTFHTEGFSWCQDLTLADSTFILPLALSASIAASVMLVPFSSLTLKKSARSHQHSNTSAFDPAIDDSERELVRLSERARKPQAAEGPLASLHFNERIGLSMSLLFFFVALKLPAGVLLYMTSSVLTGWLQTRWLTIKRPMPEPIQPCQRQLRIKVRRGFSDA